jgi:hypothetical protein
LFVDSTDEGFYRHHPLATTLFIGVPCGPRTPLAGASAGLAFHLIWAAYFLFLLLTSIPFITRCKNVHFAVAFSDYCHVPWWGTRHLPAYFQGKYTRFLLLTYNTLSLELV